MTDQHPITPPPELWKQFAAGAYTWKEAVTYAYRAGADQELEACCAWVGDGCAVLARDLRDARRPKPPSLKEQALAALAEADGADYPVVCTTLTADQHALIRRALEQLDG